MSCYIRLGLLCLFRGPGSEVIQFIVHFLSSIVPFFNECSCVNEPARPRCNNYPEFNSIGLISRS